MRLCDYFFIVIEAIEQFGTINYMLIRILILLVCLMIPLDSSFAEEHPSQAELAKRALNAYNEGKPAEAMTLLTEAKTLFPNDPAAHLTYASFTYNFAMEVRKMGASDDEWQRLTNMALLSLQEVLNITKPFIEIGDDKNNKIAAQSNYLIGEIHQVMMSDFSRARNFYTKALELNPEHELAKKSIGLLDDLELE